MSDCLRRCFPTLPLSIPLSSARPQAPRAGWRVGAAQVKPASEEGAGVGASRAGRRGEKLRHVPGSFPKRWHGQGNQGRGGADPRSAAEHGRGGGARWKPP